MKQGKDSMKHVEIANIREREKNTLQNNYIATDDKTLDRQFILVFCHLELMGVVM